MVFVFLGGPLILKLTPNTPSPVFFPTKISPSKGNEPMTFDSGRTFHLVIGDTGIESSTKETVENVRKMWQKEPNLMNGYFDEIENVTKGGKIAIEEGNISTVKRLISHPKLTLMLKMKMDRRL